MQGGRSSVDEERRRTSMTGLVGRQETVVEDEEGGSGLPDKRIGAGMEGQGTGKGEGGILEDMMKLQREVDELRERYRRTS